MARAQYWESIAVEDFWPRYIADQSQIRPDDRSQLPIEEGQNHVFDYEDDYSMLTDMISPLQQ